LETNLKNLRGIVNRKIYADPGPPEAPEQKEITEGFSMFKVK